MINFLFTIFLQLFFLRDNILQSTTIITLVKTERVKLHLQQSYRKEFSKIVLTLISQPQMVEWCHIYRQ